MDRISVIQNAATTSSSSSSSDANVETPSKSATNTVAPPMALAAPPLTSVKSTNVKLLIRASNQQFADLLIEGDMLWTVKQLKSHLAMVYPDKPPIEEQKLIYWGQLPQDAQLLKDVLRCYKDVYTPNHVFHLVRTPNIVSETTDVTSIGNNLIGNNANAVGLRQQHENHNWLHNLFSIAGIVFLFTILYIKTWPLRCLVVVIMVGGMVLVRMIHGAHNRENNEAAQMRRGVPQVQQAARAVEQQQESIVDGAGESAMPADGATEPAMTAN